VKIPIGPEDIGKRVVIIPLNKLGIVTSFTADYVSVRMPSERISTRYKREDVKYYKPDLRH